MATSPSATELLADPILRNVPVIEGFKVLAGVALYGKVGRGGMGIVYRGRHCLLGVDMAVKVLRPSLVDEDERFAARFLREAQAAAHVTHQNVVRLYEVRDEHGLHCLLMEFVDGESVQERVARKGPLPEAEALGILHGAAAGLAEAHRAGMVHRDIKPDNLLIARDGRVKLADLGLVRREPTHELSQSLHTGIWGTPQYMAPEQCRTPEVTPAADVWALGATLYFLLAGEPAVSEASVRNAKGAPERIHDQALPSLGDARSDVRPEVVALCTRCMAREPGERFADARELLDALRPLVAPDERLLADPEAGSGRASAVLPTPPPRATLERIRTALGTERSALRAPDRSEAVTVPSRRPEDGAAVASTPPAKRARRKPGRRKKTGGQDAATPAAAPAGPAGEASTPVGEPPAPVAGSSAPVAAGAPAPAPRGPSLGLLVVAAGAVGVVVGGAVNVWAAVYGPAAVGDDGALFGIGGWLLGGILLAIGWFLASLRGQCSGFAALGGLALAAGQIVVITMGPGDDAMFARGLAANVGMVLCLFVHLETLESLDFEGTRFAAMVALFGVVGDMLSLTREFDLPTWIGTAFAWCGLVGVVLFGVSLTVAALLRWRSP